MTTFIIPLALIAAAAILFIALRHRAEMQHYRPPGDRWGTTADTDNAPAPEPWAWPTWPVTREAADRRPHARRYSARERSTP